ncbi:uncharacterized protein M6B38_127730 [Iris pallida]|uniref:Uncharacterized protein n=1 Tax=Iris pallida TaxID=29817 RepID=A0AAX6E5W9_IRIPA|nr:uncharacterized protein M6B38_207285 [Iris pallida]KAJ6823731.1 uncharacterized protein M6B38_127730 [Iris pallida]
MVVSILEMAVVKWRRIGQVQVFVGSVMMVALEAEAAGVPRGVGGQVLGYCRRRHRREGGVGNVDTDGQGDSSAGRDGRGRV